MNDYLFLKYKKIVMIATTPIAIIDGAKTAIIQLAIQYATYSPMPLKVIIVDSNLRWHGRYRGEEDILGPYIFGKGTDYLNTHSHENRDLGVSFLRSHKLHFINSYYKKHNESQQLLETLFTSTARSVTGIHLFLHTLY